ncbi:hypothetical protein NM688_g8269 [Phlebia brevispora]|uniref:Uncharacterized protein n=1 Tax=Phlebia brevispora TaxID=194682 RepID=A0ACC1RV40_9APHY|nr:hypothetical protein NM688_g8269 [Phlebia brevispora]
MSPSHSRSNGNAPKPLADIITYRYVDKFVYVKPAPTYRKAIEYARTEFPELLATKPEHVTLWVNATVKGQKEKVRVSNMAYDDIVRNLVRHEIVDIVIMETPPASPRVVVTDMEAPPVYDADEKTRREYLSIDTTNSRSRSPSPPGSRPRSPSNIASRAVNWLKNEVSPRGNSTAGSSGSSSNQSMV